MNINADTARELYSSLCKAYEIMKENGLNDKCDEYRVLCSYIEDALSETAKRSPSVTEGIQHNCELHTYNLDRRCAVCGKEISKEDTYAI